MGNMGDGESDHDVQQYASSVTDSREHVGDDVDRC